jgi:hypothetical protein
VNTQDVFADSDAWRAVCAPVISTHFASAAVTTVSVSAPPCLAKTVPLCVTVPVPPENVALVTLDAFAGAALKPPEPA